MYFVQLFTVDKPVLVGIRFRQFHLLAILFVECLDFCLVKLTVFVAISFGKSPSHHHASAHLHHALRTTGNRVLRLASLYFPFQFEFEALVLIGRRRDRNPQRGRGRVGVFGR